MADLAKRGSSLAAGLLLPATGAIANHSPYEKLETEGIAYPLNVLSAEMRRTTGQKRKSGKRNYKNNH
jgi:hypothetical protein